jgi:excisionase family DNA binding protein
LASADTMTTEPRVSVEQVAQHLGVAKDIVYRWREHRGLPAHRVGRLWKFKLFEVDDWVRARGADVRQHLQTKHDLANLAAQQSFCGLRINPQNFLRELYGKSAPKEIADLLTMRDFTTIKCGSYSFCISREELFATVVEVVYLISCHLFHGEPSPTRQASECYEPAYPIIRRFLGCVS